MEFDIGMGPTGNLPSTMTVQFNGFALLDSEGNEYKSDLVNFSSVLTSAKATKQDIIVAVPRYFVPKYFNIGSVSFDIEWVAVQNLVDGP